jgi:hypothetical protein
VRKAVVAGVGVIALVFGIVGSAYAGLLPTRPIKVETASGPIYQCPPPETIHWILGQPFCW